MAYPVLLSDAAQAVLSDSKLRRVFEEAMRQMGKTGWSISRAVMSSLKATPSEVEAALKELQERQVLKSTGGCGLDAYISATPLAFELREQINQINDCLRSATGRGSG